MEVRAEFRRIILALAILASIFCASCCVLSLGFKYQEARTKLKVYRQDLAGWDACRRTSPAIFKENAEAVTECIRNLDTARQNFWVNRPTGQLVVLFVLAGLAGASGAYLATWVALWFVPLAVCRLIRQAAGGSSSFGNPRGSRVVS
jgi:hypothetical protein